jgi:hypothetical protein
MCFGAKHARIVPGSLLDCWIADRELARPVVLDGSAGLPATSPWYVPFSSSGCPGSASVRAMGRLIKARRCYAGGVETWRANDFDAVEHASALRPLSRATR